MCCSESFGFELGEKLYFFVPLMLLFRNFVYLLGAGGRGSDLKTVGLSGGRPPVGSRQGETHLRPASLGGRTWPMLHPARTEGGSHAPSVARPSARPLGGPRADCRSRTTRQARPANFSTERLACFAYVVQVSLEADGTRRWASRTLG